MFRPLALFIGLRYTRAERSNGFISFISLISMIGLTLGVAVLITVLSVMNGFDRELKPVFWAWCRKPPWSQLRLLVIGSSSLIRLKKIQKYQMSPLYPIARDADIKRSGRRDYGDWRRA